MTSIIKLIPPAGISSSDIYLNASRVDYSVLNVINHVLAGTQEGRAIQKLGSTIQMNITGVCIDENGRSAIENLELIEEAINTWNSRNGGVKPGESSTYPKINWRIGNENMLFQKLTFTEDGFSDGNEINYLLTIYIDTRV